MNNRLGCRAATFVLLVASFARAGSIELSIHQVDPGDLLLGYVTNDVRVSFTDEFVISPGLSWQQMILSLTQGRIYQSPHSLPYSAPEQFLIDLLPDHAFITFVTVGGLTKQTSLGTLVIGGATKLSPDAPLTFNLRELNIWWGPSIGETVPSPQDDFLTARITLSQSAMGTLQYYSLTKDGTERIWQLPIVAGVIIPEPASASLTFVALVAAILRFHSTARQAKR